MTDIEFIQEGKKYILHPVMNWDQQGDKVSISSIDEGPSVMYVKQLQEKLIQIENRQIR